MNREILYRGKRVDNGDWGYGYAVKGNDKKYQMFIAASIGVGFFTGGIIAYEVIPETVGQFTGLTDKNGKKIFEGDIVRRFNGRGQEVMRYAVKWNTDCCMFVLVCEDTYFGEYTSDFTVFYGEELEIVGNVHDNPNLL